MLEYCKSHYGLFYNKTYPVTTYVSLKMNAKTINI